MTKNIKYPVIFTEYNDESGNYYVVTSPNIKGLVTDGRTIAEALYMANDAIKCLLDGETYPEVQNPNNWQLKQNQEIHWITVKVS